jgi:hypothetical protein
MEHIIGKLLEEFEQGKMNRRQLIQSLAMAASVAEAATPAAAVTGKGFHAKVAHDDGKECFLVFGDSHLIPRRGRSAGATPDQETSFHIKDPDGFDLQICSTDMKP